MLHGTSYASIINPVYGGGGLMSAKYLFQVREFMYQNAANMFRGRSFKYTPWRTVSKYETEELARRAFDDRSNAGLKQYRIKYRGEVLIFTE